MLYSWTGIENVSACLGERADGSVEWITYLWRGGEMKIIPVEEDNIKM